MLEDCRKSCNLCNWNATWFLSLLKALQKKITLQQNQLTKQQNQLTQQQNLLTQQQNKMTQQQNLMTQQQTKMTQQQNQIGQQKSQIDQAQTRNVPALNPQNIFPPCKPRFPTTSETVYYFLCRDGTSCTNLKGSDAMTSDSSPCCVNNGGVTGCRIRFQNRKIYK